MYNVITYKSNWWGYIGKRVVFWIMAFIFASMLLFFLPRLLNGSQIEYDTYYPSGVCCPPPEAIQQWREEQRAIYHFNEPLILQYLRWMGGIFTGDFGESRIQPSS